MATKKRGDSITFTFSSSVPFKEVCLVGTFNEWKIGADPMKIAKNGSYQVTKKLSPGRYEYKFYMDGLYIDDSEAKEESVNEFGTKNSVVTVAAAKK